MVLSGICPKPCGQPLSRDKITVDRRLITGADTAKLDLDLKGMPTMASICIVEQTRYLLINRPRPITLEAISAGTGIPVNWLSAFSRYRLDDPGAKRIQVLFEYLSGQPLITA